MTRLLFSICAIFYSLSILNAQEESSSEFNVFYLGIAPGIIHANTIIKDNIDFELDGLVFNPTNSFTGNNSPEIHVGFQHFGSNRNVFSIEGFASLNRELLYLKETNLMQENMVRSPDSIFNPALGEEQRESNQLVVGIEVAQYWRGLKPKKERFFINVGVGIQGIYLNQDYFTFTQSSRTINTTKKSALILNLIAPVDFNLRVTPKFAVGINIGINLMSKYFVLDNSLNLDSGNPLNDKYFGNPLQDGRIRLKASYFISQ